MRCARLGSVKREGEREREVDISTAIVSPLLSEWRRFNASTMGERRGGGGTIEIFTLTKNNERGREGRGRNG